MVELESETILSKLMSLNIAWTASFGKLSVALLGFVSFILTEAALALFLEQRAIGLEGLTPNLTFYRHTESPEQSLHMKVFVIHY